MPDKSLGWQMANDARHLGFTLARYKFVAKMFAGYRAVVEIGCGNGFGGQVVRQAVGRLDGLDLPRWDIGSPLFLNGFTMQYDGAFCLDVIEHVAPAAERQALLNLSRCAPVCIIGTPSLESQQYASPESARLHVNCFTGERLREACRANWRHVFMFGQNDEVLHTGHFGMSHYLFALCVDPI